MIVAFLDAAEQEAAEAVIYYEGVDPELADAFQTEVERIVATLHVQPLLYAPHRGGYRRLNFDRFPYYAAYVMAVDTVTMVAVAHASRDPRLFSRPSLNRS